MTFKPAEVIVAGHICLDIIPTFTEKPELGHSPRLEDYLAPGKLVNVGAPVLATGGAVANTGVALHRLGIPVRLVGKVGDDGFARLILDLLAANAPDLLQGMLSAQGEPSSYTIVVNPPGVDRLFLHCPGPNDTFSEADVTLDHLVGGRIFHFGYPPLMKRFYSDGGQELLRLMSKAKACGLVTSLDMSLPDPASSSGRVNWGEFLTKVLPQVDLFLPSLDEILFMLDRPEYDRIMSKPSQDAKSWITSDLLNRFSRRLLGMGARVVAFKLGDLGLYLRTSADDDQLLQLCAKLNLPVGEWTSREGYAQCFATRVAGTTGAGDCTIAGILASLVKAQSFTDTLVAGVAVGACNVEAPDATSGVPAWEQVQNRLVIGWQQLERRLDLPGWKRAGLVWLGPQDKENIG